MKRKIMVAATGLSAGTLIATAVVNPKVASELMRTELVLAEENENLEDITEIIPDPALRAEIARKIDKTGVSADNLKLSDLDNPNLEELFLGGIEYKNLQGIEYVTSLKKLQLYTTSIKDISMLSKVPNLTTLTMSGNMITDFDVLFEIWSMPVQIKVIGKVNSIEKEISLDENNPKIYMSSYIGVNKGNDIKITKIKINTTEFVGNAIKDVYDENSGTISINDENSSGLISIELMQRFPFSVGGVMGDIDEISTTISQPYTIKSSIEPGPEPTPNPDPEPGGEKPNIEEIPKTDIMTNKATLDIYNSEGIKTGTKKLSDEITDFTTEKVNKLNSGEYYQIGDNEWVSAKDVAVFEFTDSYIQTHGSKVKDLTDFGNTGALTDRALDKSSSWYTDRSAYFDGEWHHRVSTHEWVHDDNVVQYEIASGVVNANETATLYNSKGKKVTDRALAKGSTFFTDRKATIGGKLMHRVSTDEWVDADTVTFK